MSVPNTRQSLRRLLRLPSRSALYPSALFPSALLQSALSLLLLVGALAAQDAVRFNRDVRPILSDKCFACHGPDAAHREADLRLDERAGADHVLGDGAREGSELWYRVAEAEGREAMPPADSGEELTAEELELLGRWIEQGAPYERHWTLRELRRPGVPPQAGSVDPARVDGAVDHFWWRSLVAAGAEPVAEADPVTLVRRLYLDLTGLPPAPAQVDAFVAADPATRVEALVDELLGSEAYAERMAVWWLDLVRFADTVGYHGDQEHHVAPYRDYVLKAFRDNYRFDRFTREQLAGDLLPERTTEQWVASCYNRLLQTTHEGGLQPGEYLHKYLADRVRNVSAVWMGATVGCAECHDHKFDPYAQRDFYRLGAFFADIDEEAMWRAPNTTPTKRPPEIDVRSPLHPAGAALLEGDAAKQGDRVMVTVAKAPRITRVLNRGDWMDSSGEVVEPGVPTCLPQLTTAGRATRLDLADWLCGAGHPQTARVTVNRVWALFFGRGLSTSLEDNGSQGAAPTHPELLDWLACEFRDTGWDLRHVIRQIVTSAAYRTSSVPTAELAQRDPENLLLARQGRWRLPAEFVRDVLLRPSGLLVERFGGPSARPYQPAGLYVHMNFPPRKYRADTGDQQYRRGVYTHWQRMFLQPMLKAFDAPTREECTAERSRSNTPLQALALLNDPSAVEAARSLAARALLEGGASDDERLRFAWRELLSREPGADEIDVLRGLLESQRLSYEQEPSSAAGLVGVGQAPTPDQLGKVELAAWTAVMRTLFNLGEAFVRA